ncbi:hypothetical protein QBC44DRAFT_235547 [Cladorrhinum sp. PSN332]|nr:hypothetical protein QBC44DRAFT_235547 [Cladorrhinum sp. PSN332]
MAPSPLRQRVSHKSWTSLLPGGDYESVFSVAASHLTDVTLLHGLQERFASDTDYLEPLNEEEIEPGSFDLIPPPFSEGDKYLLEERAELLFSSEHLELIFADPVLLASFAAFLRLYRPASLPLFSYYFDALKALKAIDYSNSILKSLNPLGADHEFARDAPFPTVNIQLQERIDSAFDALVRVDLPAFITHKWIQTASITIRKRITGTLPDHLREMSEGLAEIFCMTDPSREDNPVIFASEEFYRLTQYGVKHTIGRNCRFLQGPNTNSYGIERIRTKLAAGKEHYETILNYRRDGSPFMNLLMCAPLLDSHGAIRYMIGAQIDVSGLVQECAGLESLQRLVDNQLSDTPETDPFKPLAQLLTNTEMETVRTRGGTRHRLLRPQAFTSLPLSQNNTNWQRPRLVTHDPDDYGDDDDKINSRTHTRRPASSSAALPRDLYLNPTESPGFIPSEDLAGGRLAGIYSQYLLVRPFPSLRILFASPSLRVPGILQTPLLSRIGGPDRVREELSSAFTRGGVVTARIRWLAGRQDREGRPRWIHCTPLMGSNGAVGVWMVVIVDEEVDGVMDLMRRGGGKVAPVIETNERIMGMRVGGGRKVMYDQTSLASLSHLDLSMPPPTTTGRG